MVEAKSRYAEDHPRIRSLAQQIGDVQRELGDAVKDSTPSSTGTGQQRCRPTIAPRSRRWWRRWRPRWCR